jgi:hypothetical protein
VAGDAGAEAARARVAALLDELTRMDLQLVVVAPPDEARLAARDQATEAAIIAGRGDLLYEATAAVREAVLRTFARAGFNGTWAVTDMAVSVTRADDRVAAAAAYEEAAMAAVVEDLVTKKTLTVLRTTSGELTRLQGLPTPGSLSTIAASAPDAAGPRSTVLIIILIAVIVVGAFAVGSTGGGIFALFVAAVIIGLLRRKPPATP